MTTKISPLTCERLRAVLSYDPITGVFTRRCQAGSRKDFAAGTVAGCLDVDSGYIRIGIDGRRYWAHRLAWLYVHGVDAPEDVDHRDRIRSHNWISNLRAVSRAENLQNQVEPGPRNVSGARGVQWDERRGRWRVEISVNNRNKFVGRFDDLSQAVAARDDARRMFHPGAIL